MDSSYEIRQKQFLIAAVRLLLGTLCNLQHSGTEVSECGYYTRNVKERIEKISPWCMCEVIRQNGTALSAQSLGVCYGGNGNANNLPTESEVVSLCKTYSIEKIRLYSPYPEILQPLRDSNIELIVGVPNESLQDLANPSSAADWVQKNIKDYSSNVKFRYIAVGNEVNLSSATAQSVLPAMQAVHKAIVDAGLQTQIKVSTAVDTNLLDVFDPPSAGVVVRDGNLEYRNLFDALMDALYSALEKINGGSLAIVVSESGWPSAGGAVETLENAGTYYKNLINHVKGGTPKRPGMAIDTYLFSFDENLKTEEIEKHFGLFYPNKQLKYDVSFS
ncbi:Glucan endo-1,3-beta-glucosidase, basic vacuolar isoform [Morella rubra]|uniref:glucan endo-1,3-beta-D-glucosidase n=1 Tax=Morella rubra TaxID=262757 RepID=A0A6A1WRS9_9ROSI|nr:Glucan endo-1,3-beta-glucosidase, basic vacuolar isoform [Morella rubra]